MLELNNSTICRDIYYANTMVGGEGWWPLGKKDKGERKIYEYSIGSKAKPHSPQTYSSEKNNEAHKRVGAEKKTNPNAQYISKI